jgi:uncharacterized membrane protein YoaK (UPF0700 family)
MLDALSYVRAHVFTANMTGNLVLIGIRLVQGDFSDALRSLFALGSFAAGCILAGFLLLRREETQPSSMSTGFAAELFLLAVYAGLFRVKQSAGAHMIPAALIFTAAAALAIQSVTVRRLRVSGVVTTFITGTISTSMVGLVRIIRGDERRAEASKDAEEKHVGLLLGMLSVYLIAVMFAAALSSRQPLIAGNAPFVVLAAVWLRSRKHTE